MTKFSRGRNSTNNEKTVKTYTDGGLSFDIVESLVDIVMDDHPHPEITNFCRVYWGSHGCQLERGHKGHHECSCCICEGEHTSEPDEDNVVCVWLSILIMGLILHFMEKTHDSRRSNKTS